jgi:hypothetical protein
MKYHATITMGEFSHSVTYSYPQQLLELSGQLQAPAALSQGQ